MLIAGVITAVESIIAPDMSIMTFTNAWLPVTAFIIFTVGVIEFFDTYFSRYTAMFFSNIQFAIFDLVFGGVLFWSSAYSATKLSILIAVYLMVKSLFRVVLAFQGSFVNATSAKFGSIISFLLGLAIWLHWPLEPSIAFLSFCLSVEIALRGWTLVQFSYWLIDNYQPSEDF